MPNCFTLTRKTDPAAGPVKLSVVDEEMCRHFNVPCHPAEWYCSWYGIIGWHIAMGDTFASMRTKLEVEIAQQPVDIFDIKRILDIVNWLDDQFISDTWVTIGK